MQFKSWQHPKTKAHRIYWNHGYRGNVRVWFEEDPETAAPMLHIEDEAAEGMLQEHKDALADHMAEAVAVALEEATGQPADTLTFDDLAALGGAPRQAKKRNQVDQVRTRSAPGPPKKSVPKSLG